MESRHLRSLDPYPPVFVEAGRCMFTDVYIKPVVEECYVSAACWVSLCSKSVTLHTVRYRDLTVRLLSVWVVGQQEYLSKP